MIIPEKLRKEEEKLANEYYQSTEECGMLEYAMKHGSDELRAFYEAYDKEKQQAKKFGLIIN